MIDPEFWRQLLKVLGWALIHFTWQGTFVAILLAGVLRILRGRSTNARYAAACAALLLMLAAPLATMAIGAWLAPGGTANELSPVFAAQPEARPVAAGKVDPFFTDAYKVFLHWEPLGDRLVERL